MNMKKTMAAIAAGAVAVSAMATTVSAINEGTYTYSLVQTVNSQAVPTKTFTFTVNAPAPVEGQEATEGTAATPDTYLVDEDITIDETLYAKNSTMTATAYAALTAADVDKNGTAISTLFAASEYKCNTAEAGYAVGDTLTAAQYTALEGAGTITAAKWAVNAYTNAADVIGAKTYKAGTELTADEYEALDYTSKKSVIVTEGTPATEDTPAVEAVEYPDWIQFGGWAVGPDAGVKVEKLVVKINPSATGEQNKTYTYSPNKANEGWNGNFRYDAANGGYRLNFTEELANYTSALTISVTVETIDSWWMATDVVNDRIAAGGITASADEVATTPVVYAGSGANKTLAETVYVPFETNLKDNTNILWYLENGTNLKGEWNNSYNNVTAVINDAIANFDSVTFKFNTCSSPVKYVVGLDSVADEHGNEFVAWDYDTRFNTYEAAMIDGANALAEASNKDNNGKYVNWDNYYVAAVYDDSDGCDKTYTTFAQHLYTNYYDPEGTTWTGFAWEGHNLFQGALIVNEGLTMSLAQTDYFQWNETSLSFDWDGIMDYSITENSYATYLHSMKLATSTRWYWDSMVVECVAGEEEDAASDAGVDGDGAELDEDTESEEIPADDTADEEPAPEVDEEPAPAPEVSNPTTGNASVALAVIPVALAAAAVVAKKRS